KALVTLVVVTVILTTFGAIGGTIQSANTCGMWGRLNDSERVWWVNGYLTAMDATGEHDLFWPKGRNVAQVKLAIDVACKKEPPDFPLYLLLPIIVIEMEKKH